MTKVPDLKVIDQLVDEIRILAEPIINKKASMTVKEALILRRYCMLCPISGGHRAACAWAVRMGEWANRITLTGKDGIKYHLIKVSSLFA